MSAFNPYEGFPPSPPRELPTLDTSERYSVQNLSPNGAPSQQLTPFYRRNLVWGPLNASAQK